LLCNAVVPQVLWFRKARNSIPVLFAVSLVVSVGMWLERFIIIVTSLHRDFLPSSWDMYHGTKWDWGTFVGTLGLFFTLFFLFIRPVLRSLKSAVTKGGREEAGHKSGASPRAR